MSYELSHLRSLEAEAIHIIREVAAEFERPAMLFSGGKDSAVMLHLAVKAFYPAKPPFPLLHIDTGHNFPEVLTFRDETVERTGVRLEVASVQQAIDEGKLTEQTGRGASRNQLQTLPLLEAIEKYRFDALFGGGRRDEEKARAKERVFSHRDDFGQCYRPGDHFRVFPLSNWTELDIWQYIEADEVALPNIYYAHRREVFLRDGMWLSVGPHVQPGDDEVIETRIVRYRTVGDMSCTGAVESPAATNAEIVAEVAAARVTERGATRADDRASEAAMEDRKKLGYF